MVSLWKSLHLMFSSFNTRVELAHWNSDWRAHAEFVDRMCADQHASIVIAGYSWGGYSSTLLARELGKHGRKVQRLVLCDAVYRHKYWLGNWRALCPFSRIKVPANVEEAIWFRQKQNFPRGHNLKPESDTTVIRAPQELDFRHEKMDESYRYHRDVFRECQRVMGKGSIER